jgi:hypothetical protein
VSHLPWTCTFFGHFLGASRYSILCSKKRCNYLEEDGEEYQDGNGKRLENN